MDAHQVLFRHAFRTLWKSASRIVAWSIHVKKTLRNSGVGSKTCLTFPICALASHYALRLPSILAYAFPMRYVLGFDGEAPRRTAFFYTKPARWGTRLQS